MQAADIMSKTVISVSPEMTVQELARLLLEKQISGVPVIDEDGMLQGIVSEGDLVRRTETDTAVSGSWWLDFFASPATRQDRFVKSHGRRVGDVMTRNPLTIAPDTSLADVATILQKNSIKRLPVVADGVVVGIVSRANLLRGLIAAEPPAAQASTDDRALREAIEKAIANADISASGAYLNIVVHDGVALIFGSVNSDQEERAILVAAESVTGVVAVENKLGRVPVWAYGY